MAVLLLILSLVELVVAIWTSTLYCTMCCCKASTVSNIILNLMNNYRLLNEYSVLGQSYLDGI